MRERSLVAFTLLAQAAVGMFWALAGVWWIRGDPWAGTPGTPGTPGATDGRSFVAPLLVVGALVAGAVAASLAHLGSPRNAWRALSNLRASWLSREILFLALFAGGWAVVVVQVWLGSSPAPVLMGGVAALGVGLVYCMSRVYRLRTVPAWDAPLTTAAFFLTAGSVGGLAAALATGLSLGTGEAPRILVLVAGTCVVVELGLEGAWRGLRRRAAAQVDAGLNAGVPVEPVGVLRAWLLVVALAFSGAAVAGSGQTALIASALGTTWLAGVVGRSAFYRSHARRGL